MVKKSGEVIAKGSENVRKLLENIDAGILGRIKTVSGKVEYTNFSGSVLKWSTQHPNSIKQSITNALSSTNAGKLVEDKVADALQKAGKEVKAFGLKINNSTTSKLAGDIDVETSKHIIEVKKSFNAWSGKKDQVNKFVNSDLDNYLNPFQKKAVLYIDEPLSAANRSRILSHIPDNVTLVDSLSDLNKIVN